MDVRLSLLGREEPKSADLFNEEPESLSLRLAVLNLGLRGGVGGRFRAAMEKTKLNSSSKKI